MLNYHAVQTPNNHCSTCSTQEQHTSTDIDCFGKSSLACIKYDYYYYYFFFFYFFFLFFFKFEFKPGTLNLDNNIFYHNDCL